MTQRLRITRRALPGLLASFGGLWTARSWAAVLGPRDQGIGGTGGLLVPDRDNGDRGIGGTGVVGTIRGFGSIVVNGLHIAYPPGVVVRIDGSRASAADLKIGQVVETRAAWRGGLLSTRRIDVCSEVVGPVERVSAAGLVVLGQQVVTGAATGGRRVATNWRVGETVAVSGLRRPDGSIVASLIERRPGAVLRLAGPVRRGPDGVSRIGDLKLDELPAGDLGRRLLVTGRRVGDRFEIASRRETTFAGSVPSRLLVEAYVEHAPAGLVLGSGLKVRTVPGLANLPRAFRAILATRVDRSGQLTVDAVAIESGERSGRGGHGAGAEHGGPGFGPGGPGPGLAPGPGGDPHGPGPAGPPGPGGDLGAPGGLFGGPGGDFGQSPGMGFSSRPGPSGNGGSAGLGRGGGR